ncbi:hypothetical protein KKF91_03035 [Myxococcota bacterium]|nr:hypothetical protein [Myxococcota bacterium]MBU1429515.1 hypothetical protein [Myxococcota bacterium]MBU1896576.1 hypothetical protein [Myxococcota bacterium]
MLNEGCLAPEVCRLIAGGEARCLPIESATAPCAVGSCAVGEACLQIEGLIRCARVCLEDTDCGVGVCAYEIGRWGVCVSPCDLLSQCNERGACAPIEGLPFPICIAEGEAGEGEACGACQRGLGCLAVGGAPACQRLCTPDLPGLCRGASCDGPIEGVEGLRYCR